MIIENKLKKKWDGGHLMSLMITLKKQWDSCKCVYCGVINRIVFP